MRPRLLTFVIAICACFTVPELTMAGTFEVTSCGQAPGGVNNAWHAAMSTPTLTMNSTCPPTDDPWSGLSIYDTLGEDTPPGAVAEWDYVAAPGTRIIGAGL